jgi:hypothetical protein
VEARKRLALRFGSESAKRLAEQYGCALPDVEAVTSVADAVRMTDEDFKAKATPEDVDDALLSVARARVQLLVDEQALIEAARANGRSWERIGELLGASEAVAKARPAKLRRAIEDLSRVRV